MTDAVWQAPKIRARDLGYERLLADDKIRKKRRRSENWFLRWIAGCSIAIATGATLSNLYLSPAQKLVPLYVVVNQDGTLDPKATITDLAPSQQRDVIDSALARFVQTREGYSWDHAQQDFDLVRLMLEQPLRRQYEHWFTEHPDSPQAKIGKGGSIQIKILTPPVPVARQEQVRDVRYMMLTSRPGEPAMDIRECSLRKDARCTTHTATVGYKLVRSILDDERLLNPARIKIVSYFIRDGAV